MGGLAVDPSLDAWTGELADHLRALLRDVLCGHLDSDLAAVADDIIGQDAGTVAASAPGDAALGPDAGGTGPEATLA